MKNDKTVMPVNGVFEQFFVDFTKLIILSQKSDIVGMFEKRAYFGKKKNNSTLVGKRSFLIIITITEVHK